MIERLPNGLWRFVFGKSKDSDPKKGSPVDMYIRGDIQMKCFRKRCGHWMTLPFIPFFDKPKDNEIQ